MTTTSWQPDTFIRLSDYREVEEVLRRAKDFVLSGTKAESDEFVHGTLVAIDGREHMARRRELLRMLSPQQPWGAEGTLLDELYAGALERLRATRPAADGDHHVDLIGFLRDIMWRYTATLVGLDGIKDAESIDGFLDLALPVLQMMAVEYLPEQERPGVMERARIAAARIRSELFEPNAARRVALLRQVERGELAREDLPSDLITSLIEQDGSGPAALDLAFREMLELLAGSVNSPVSQTAWAFDDLIRWLPEHPQDAGRLGERAFLNLAVHETLRLHRSSRPYLVRIALGDTVLESTGRSIPAGSWVASWVGAANQDPSVFGDRPDEYDLHRTPLDPKVPAFGVAFGAGAHVCLGRPLLIWEKGEDSAQGVQAKLLRMTFAAGTRFDPQGVHDEVGVPGGRRFDRYDVLIPSAAMLSAPAASGCPFGY